MRVLFDVTFTRTQQHPTGIPRTVLRLSDALALARPDVEVVPVAFHSRGWRRARFRQEAAEPHATGAPTSGRPGGPWSWWIDKAAPWVSARLPLAWRHFLVSHYHRLLFDRISRRDAPIPPRPGDLLLLADASWNYAAWRGARAVRAAGGRVVLVVHDIMPLRQPAFCSAVFASMFAVWLQRMLACSDAVICNSGATQSDLRDWAASHAVDLPPVGWFRLGHDGARAAARSPVRPELAAFLDGPEATFASIGTFEPKKNHTLLLDAFELLWQQGHPVRLVVAGRPTEQSREVVERFRAHPEQGRRLLMLLDANDAEVATLYARSRALVLTSLFEGFGLPLVEARTQGCAVIASNLPAFRELADAGVLFYADAAPASLAELVAHVATHGLQAPAMPAFTWEQSAAQCLQQAEALLASAAVRGGPGAS